MGRELIERFDVLRGDLVSDRRGRDWIVLGYHFGCGGNCMIVRVMLAKPVFGFIAWTKYLADGEFEEFQAAYVKA